MRNKTRNLWIVLTMVFVLFVCAISLTFDMFTGNVRAKDNGEPTLIGGEIKEEYILNDFIEIPAAKIIYGEETKDAEISVIKPDGKRLEAQK